MQRATMTALIVLFLLFGVPLLEILVFIEIGGRIGGVATVVITVLTACVGMALFRSQSLNALEQTRTQLKIGEKLLEEVLGGLGLLLAALFLFIPGFITDIIGLLLFIPALRLFFVALLLRPLTTRGVLHAAPGEARVDDSQDTTTIIEGEYRVLDDTGTDQRDICQPDALSEPNTAKKPKPLP